MFEHVEVELNSMCNRRCTYCPNSIEPRPTGYMSYSTFVRLVDGLQQMKYEGTLAYHFYGEPLLDKRLPTFAAIARDLLPAVQQLVLTNGDYLSDLTYRVLREAGINQFWVTLHDNVLPPPLARLLDTFTESFLQPHLRIRLQREMQLHSRSGLVNVGAKLTAPLPEPCNQPSKFLTVLFNGDVTLCCNDFYAKHVYGNVHRAGLAELWNNLSTGFVRNELLNGNRNRVDICRQCELTSLPEGDFAEASGFPMRPYSRLF